MGEAFMTRRGGSLNTYDVRNATFSTDKNAYDNSIVISGLNLPDNVKSFCVQTETSFGDSYSGGGSSGYKFLIFTLTENDGAYTRKYNLGSSLTDEGNLGCSYEVIDGNLHIRPYDYDGVWKYQISYPHNMGGIIVCG